MPSGRPPVHLREALRLLLQNLVGQYLELVVHLLAHPLHLLLLHLHILGEHLVAGLQVALLTIEFFPLTGRKIKLRLYLGQPRGATVHLRLEHTVAHPQLLRFAGSLTQSLLPTLAARIVQEPKRRGRYNQRRQYTNQYSHHRYIQ